MTTVYNNVTVAVLPNYLGAWLQLPSNLHFREWEGLARTEEDTRLINFLKYGFTMGYEGLVPTPHICYESSMGCGCLRFNRAG